MITEQFSLNKRKSISEVFAIVAISLLTMDTFNTFTSQDGIGLLYLTDRQSGYISVCLLYFCFLYHSGLELGKEQE
jgi:hypothetical protein